MATLNLGEHLTPSFVGFDRLFNEFERTSKTPGQLYPPHNVIKYADGSKFIIELAVAGYAEKDIEILQEKDVLTIRTVDGYVPTWATDIDATYIHHGLSAKRFSKAFTLADGVKVEGANLQNGILAVKLYLEIPENERPKYITINGTRGDPQLLTE